MALCSLSRQVPPPCQGFPGLKCTAPSWPLKSSKLSSPPPASAHLEADRAGVPLIPLRIWGEPEDRCLHGPGTGRSHAWRLHVLLLAILGQSQTSVWGLPCPRFCSDRSQVSLTPRQF